jgi:diguanylate cyclase (GGDEF)-like protein
MAKTGAPAVDETFLGKFATLIAAARRIDWRRRDVIDGIVIIALTGVMYLLAHIFELPPLLFQWALDNADWEMDDAVFLVAVLGFALSIYVGRRHGDLVREIAARKAAEAESLRLARHDPLTGLPNRRYFAEKLDEILRHAGPAERTALLMLDLDGFKAINDMHGHGVGDDALVEFATRLSEIARPGMFMARLGGDEFALVLTRADDDAPARVAHRIVAALAKPITAGGRAVTLGVGIGIAVAPDNGVTPDVLVRRADIALYRAKADGRSLIRFFQSDMDKHIERRAMIERELREAIAARSVAVHYQPLVNLDGRQIIGFEALARWTSPSLGPLPPAEFIPVAEETGLIVPLGHQLLQAACRDAARWPANLTLSFNVSAVELRDPIFGLSVLGILADAGLDPRRLELEVTESAMIGDAEIAKTVIDALRDAGVRIALDDFGTGYATMSQLLALRFDKIKIDRRFVDRLGKDPQSDVIVRATIGLARGLGLNATAEGIETAEQLASLQAEGCAEGQGFMFGRDVAAAEIPALLAESRRSRSAA